jgi:hypothetical protein
MALLDAGPLLEARLRAACPAAGDNVFTAADLAGVKEKSQVTPALHLVLHSYRPVADDGAADSLWREIWLVVAVVRNARQNVGTRALREAASPLLKEAVAALDGWRCPGATGVVRAIDGPAPLFTDGLGYLPLAFAVNTVTPGAEDC